MLERCHIGVAGNDENRCLYCPHLDFPRHRLLFERDQLRGQRGEAVGVRGELAILRREWHADDLFQFHLRDGGLELRLPAVDIVGNGRSDEPIHLLGVADGELQPGDGAHGIAEHVGFLQPTASMKPATSSAKF